MSHWRSGTFWASAIFAWFVTLVVLALGICIFGSEDMNTAEGIVANVAHQVSVTCRRICVWSAAV